MKRFAKVSAPVLILAGLAVAGCADGPGSPAPAVQVGVVEAPLGGGPWYKCKGAQALLCDDGNPCTQDGCDNKTKACTHTNLPNGTACTDSNACTQPGTCTAGVCGAVAPVDCDDDNPCTDDGCSPTTGCTHTNNSDPCDDDDACTGNDFCAAGACAGAPIDCDDGDACTLDSCTGGVCAHTTPHDTCDEGDLLPAGCGTCSDTICATDPWCCTVNWDSQCVSEVRTLCGSLRCDEATGFCNHSLCTTDGPLTEGCDPADCVSTICDQDPYCCTSFWDNQCLGEVNSYCGLNCD